jgi:hypothetical protein
MTMKKTQDLFGKVTDEAAGHRRKLIRTWALVVVAVALAAYTAVLVVTKTGQKAPEPEVTDAKDLPVSD